MLSHEMSEMSWAGGLTGGAWSSSFMGSGDKWVEGIMNEVSVHRDEMRRYLVLLLQMRASTACFSE